MSGVRVGGWEGVAKVLRRKAQKLRKSFPTTQPNITNNENIKVRKKSMPGFPVRAPGRGLPAGFLRGRCFRKSRGTEFEHLCVPMARASICVTCFMNSCLILFLGGGVLLSSTPHERPRRCRLRASDFLLARNDRALKIQFLFVDEKIRDKRGRIF